MNISKSNYSISTYPNMKLRDCVSFKTGKLNSNAAKKNGIYPFFTCSQDIYKIDTFSFDTECVLLGGNNANGIYPIFYYKGKFDVYQRTYVIQSLDKKKLINRYLFYALKIQLDLLRSISTGVATKFLTLTILNDIEIPHPSLLTQRKIAAILSAYDDLIENNTRRIKILEEMAQAIYREWFVHFRFPGHEGVQMVESELGMIPEGWEVKRLDDVAEVIDCLHGIKPTEVTNKEEKYGILLHVWNIGDNGKLDLSKKFFITEEIYRLWTKRIEVKCGDCVITNVGRIGAVAQIPFDVKAAIGRNMTAIRCKKGIITPTYLIEYLCSPYFEREKTLKQDSGTVMGSLNVKGIVKLNVPLAPFEFIKEFEANVRPVRYRIEMFQKQNEILRRTRDLLLPKLISGEVDVSELDITIHEAEA